MVFHIIDDILSTSVNRVLYETLWNLSMNNQRKSNKRSELMDQSIVQVCNEIIEEIKRDDPDRNKFYFSTQLAFGCLLMYQSQIERLYNQVKFALNSCNATFYEIDWLIRINEEADLTLLPVPKPNGSARKNQKQRGQQAKAKDDMDLLEEIFNIPETQVPSKGKGRQPAEDLDPTMATSTKDITLMERYKQPVFRDLKMPETTEVHEFGASDEGFDFSFVNALAEPSVRQLDLPERLRETQQINEPEVVDFPEVSLSYDVMETVNAQKSTRDHRLVFDGEPSQRLESPSKDLGVNEEDPEAQDINNNSCIYDQSSEDEVIPDTGAAVPATPQDLITETFAAAIGSEGGPEALMKLSPVKTVRKQKARNTKLIVDKQTMISSEVIKKNTEKYEKFTVEMPMETFESRWDCIKRENTNVWVLPSSRLKTGAKLLLPIFNRNLKRISKAMLKRPRVEIDADQPVESPPKKKRATRKSSLEVPIEDSPIKEASQQQQVVIEEASQQPVIEEVLQLEPIMNYEQPELADVDLMPLIQSPKKKRDQRKEADNGEYDAGEKWSKQKIMDVLDELWEQNTKPIKMPNLCRKTNRFVAAGIFFELMVMSKTGAVELEQGEQLEISNITRGLHADIYC